MQRILPPAKKTQRENTFIKTQDIKAVLNKSFFMNDIQDTTRSLYIRRQNEQKFSINNADDSVGTQIAHKIINIRCHPEFSNIPRLHPKIPRDFNEILGFKKINFHYIIIEINWSSL